MADELISRQAVKDAFHAYMARRFDKDRCATAENCETCEGKCLWHEVVASVPAVDAIEVVRCKDCEYRGGTGPCALDTYAFEVVDDGFCSYGVRREENA